jgi:hypothetical protein
MRKHEAYYIGTSRNITLGKEEVSFGKRGNEKVYYRLAGSSRLIQLKENDTISEFS